LLNASNAGRVGIGNTNPQAILDIGTYVSGSTTNYPVRITNYDTSGGIDFWSSRPDASNGFYRICRALTFPNYLAFYADSVPALSGFAFVGTDGRVLLNMNTNTGYVGVGLNQNAPASPLDVSGTISIRGSGPLITATGPDNPGDMLVRNDGTTNRYGIGQYNLGQMRLFGSGSSSLARIHLSKPTNSTQTGAATFTDILSVDLANSRVGIGNANPTVTLDVSGDIYAENGAVRMTGTPTSGLLEVYDISSSTTISGMNFVKTNNGGATNSGMQLGRISAYGRGTTDIGVAARILMVQDGNSSGNNIPGYISFLTSTNALSTPAERVRINSGGNVGIGTASPGDYKLSIVGNLDLGGNSSTYQHMRLNGGVSYGYIYTASPSPLYVNTISMGYNFYVDSSGTSIIPNTGGGTSRIDCGFGSIRFSTGTFNTAPTERMFINLNGRVGIGTNNPQGILHVEDTTAIATTYMGNLFSGVQRYTYISIEASTGTNGVGMIGVTRSTATAVELPLIINRYGGTAAPVLIGNITSAPSGYKLAVDGDATKNTGGSAWGTLSDIRIKKDIVDADLELCYQNIESLRLKYFEWDSQYVDRYREPDRHVLGLIAQEVKQKFPKAVTITPSKQFCVNKYDASGNLLLDEKNREIFEYKYIDDCHVLNIDQIEKAHIGATQRLMQIVKEQATTITALQSEIAAIKAHIGI
jgi:hypothetical protein